MNGRVPAFKNGEITFSYKSNKKGLLHGITAVIVKLYYFVPLKGFFKHPLVSMERSMVSLNLFFLHGLAPEFSQNYETS